MPVSTAGTLSAKKHRVVANPKPVNRRGGGKPQPREITSEKRINDIRLAVRRHMMDFLRLRDIEIPAGTRRADYIDCLTGIDGDMTMLQLVEATITAEKPEFLAPIQEAFAYGHGLVADAPLIWMPGAHQAFFGPATAKLQKNRAKSIARQNRAESIARRNAQSAARKGGKAPNHFQQAMLGAGHAKPSQLPVNGMEGAKRVHSASGKQA